MNCSSCAANVRAPLEALDQGDSAVVDLSSGLVKVKGGNLCRDRLAAAFRRAGFSVTEEKDP